MTRCPASWALVRPAANPALVPRAGATAAPAGGSIRCAAVRPGREQASTSPSQVRARAQDTAAIPLLLSPNSLRAARTCFRRLLRGVHQLILASTGLWSLPLAGSTQE